MIVDSVLVYVSLLLAIAVSVLYQSIAGYTLAAQHVVRLFVDLKYSNQKYLQAEGSPANKSNLDVRVMAAFSGQGAGA